MVNYHITYSAEEFLTICIKYDCVLFSPGFKAAIALMSRTLIFCDKVEAGKGTFHLKAWKSLDS